MTFARKTILILSFALLVFAGGDLFNFPLWPIDWLNPTFPIEVRLDFADVDEVSRQNILSQSPFLELNLCDADGRILRRLKTDENGIARYVVQQGRYSFFAAVPFIDENKLTFFAYPPEKNHENTVQKIQKKDKVVRLVLHETSDIPDGYREEVFRIYLQNADFQFARVFASDISETAETDVKKLSQIQEEIADLPVNAYNSLLNHLDSASEILSRYGIEEDKRILRTGHQTISLSSRRSAIRHARNVVVTSYISMIQQFLDKGQLVSALEEWNQLVSNSELYSAEIAADPLFVHSFEMLKPQMEDVSVLIPDEVSTQLKNAEDYYYSGDIIRARTEFTRLLTLMQDLNLGQEFEETETVVGEYLEDIEIIVTANYAVRMDQLQKALDLYDLVARPNDLVRERLSETMAFLQLREGEPLD